MLLDEFADRALLESLESSAVLARARLSSGEMEAVRGFSFGRMLNALSKREPFTGHEMKLVGITNSQAPEVFPDSNRSWLPLSAFSRALGTVGGAKGGYLVGVGTVYPFDVLRPWSVVAKGGVTVIPNLKGNIVAPRVTGNSTVTWLGAENATGPAESPPALGAASLTQRTVLCTVKFSMQLVRQADHADAILSSLLLSAVSEALDTAFFAGAGGKEPFGLLQTPGIGTQAGASLAHAGILAMRKTVLNSGGLEDRLQWVGPPVVQETLGARERMVGGGRFLWDTDGVAGRPAHATKTAPAGTLTVGDFSQAVVGIFGPGIRIDVDPSQDFNAAGLVARVLLFCDVAFPQPSAFCVATSVT